MEKDYGYLLAKFPIALLKKECSDEISEFLSQQDILIEEYSENTLVMWMF